MTKRIFISEKLNRVVTLKSMTGWDRLYEKFSSC